MSKEIAVIGMDIGHSSVKLALARFEEPKARKHVQFPTAVINAFEISNEDTKKKAANETVSLEGQGGNTASFFFGETAIRQGRSSAFSGQTKDWVKSSTHDVLVLGAWKKAFEVLDPYSKHIAVVLGLPTAYYAGQKKELQTRIHSLLAPLIKEGQTLEISIKAQSEAPLQTLVFDEDGAVGSRHQMSRESWAVIEVGHFTTDFSLCVDGDMIEDASGSDDGAHMVYERVSATFGKNGWSTRIEVIDKAIKTGAYIHYGQPLDISQIIDEAKAALSNKVVDTAKRLLGEYAPSLSGVLVAGGGAPLIFDGVKSQFPNATVTSEPTFTVAEGFCRVGLALARRKAD